MDDKKKEIRDENKLISKLLNDLFKKIKDKNH